MHEGDFLAILRKAFESLDVTVEDALRRELACDILLTGNDRLLFCIGGDTLGILLFQTNRVIVPDYSITNAIPEEAFENADAAGVDGYSLLLDLLLPWFAARWEAVGGPRRYRPAYAFYFGWKDEKQYDLEQRRWCDRKEVWPAGEAGEGKKTASRQEERSPWLTAGNVDRDRGLFILHRFLGDEVYPLRSATLRAIPRQDGGVTLWFEAIAGREAYRRCPDTDAQPRAPKIEVGIDLPALNVNALVGRTFLMQGTMSDEEDSCQSLMVYYEHEPVRDNRMTVLSRNGDRFMVRWTAVTRDVNFYDGSEPETEIEIEGEFEFRRMEEWS